MSDRCTARVKATTADKRAPGPANPPMWCCLPAGHDGPHKCNFGGMVAPVPFRDSDEIEWGKNQGTAMTENTMTLERRILSFLEDMHTQPPEWTVAESERLHAELLAHLSRPVSVSDEVAKFGHHPNPAIDFCVEVEELLGEIYNESVDFTNGTPNSNELRVRIDTAMAFKVGGDANAVVAKQQLRAALEADRAGRGVGSDKTLPVVIYGKSYEVPIPVQLHIVALEEKLSAGNSVLVSDDDAYWACKHQRITRDEPSQAEMMRAKRHLEWFAKKIAQGNGGVRDGWKPTNDEVDAWRGRNDMVMFSLGVCRTAIDDARSMHLLAAAPQPDAEGG